MARAYFPLFFDQYITLVTNLNDEEAGRLFRAMLFYAKDGTELGLGWKESVVWPAIQRDIDHSKAAYERKCAVNAVNGKKGAVKRWEEDMPTDSERHRSPANDSQSDKSDKANKADQSEEAKAEKADHSKQSVQAEQARKAEEAGRVERVEKTEVEETFEERRKRYMAMLADDYIREQREQQRIG